MRARRHDAQLYGFGQPLRAQSSPTRVVTAFVLGNELGRRLHRHMVGLKTHVGKKGLVFAAIRLNVADGAVHKILRGIKLGRHLGGLPVLKPIHLRQVRQVLLGRLPVVRAGIALHDRLIKAAPVGQVVGL